MGTHPHRVDRWFLDLILAGEGSEKSNHEHIFTVGNFMADVWKYRCSKLNIRSRVIGSQYD
jgi:hypothetical protein